MTHSEEMREFARALFGTQQPAGSEPGPTTDPRGNRSPGEGQGAPKPDPDREMREYVRDLFAPIDD